MGHKTNCCCPELEEVEVPAVVAWANIGADGTVIDSFPAGITATRTAAGVYSVPPPAGARSVQLTVLEDGQRDSIEIHPTAHNGVTAEISEGDNGTAANFLRDRAFNVVWYGTVKQLKLVQ